VVDDKHIQSLIGDLYDCVVTECLRLVAALLPAADRRKLLIFDAAHSASMLPIHDGDGSSARIYYTDTYGAEHVSDNRVLYVATNPGGHWTLNVVDNPSNTICTLDSLPGDNGGGVDDEARCAPNTSRYALARRNRTTRRVLEAFLTRECVRLNAPARPSKYAEATKPANLSTQNDSTSCGAFVFAYLYFLLVHGRLPTPADFTGANHLALCLVMLHACITGTLRRGVLPGGGAAAGGAATA
jgi:hypothetical protein